MRVTSSHLRVFILIVAMAEIGTNSAVAWQTEPIQPVAAKPNIGKPKPLIVGETFQLDSKVTGEAHQINVWMPPKTEENAKYPVLYLIDGGVDQDFQHIAGLAQLATINGRYEVPIVVGVRTSNRQKQLTAGMTDPRYLPWNKAYSMGGADKFHQMIQEEVRPFVEAEYPHDGRRIVLGESLAGFFVMREFLRYPNSFTHYICVSPSLWLDDRRLARDAATLLQKHDSSPRKLYVTIANEGGTMRDGLDRVLAAIKAANSKTLELTFVDRSKSESHSTIYHGATLDALTKLFGKPTPDYGPLPWYLREDGKPEDDKK
ncbi:MAG: alpha/beta hydrolase [Planctomycetaceae bacterium]